MIQTTRKTNNASLKSSSVKRAKNTGQGQTHNRQTTTLYRQATTTNRRMGAIKTHSKTTVKKVSPHKKTTRRISWKWRLFKWSLIIDSALFLAICGYVFYCYLTMPNMQKAVAQTRQPSTVIMAENGNDIAKFGNVYAQVIYPDKLPKNLTNAIIAIEDHRFYKHFGFDIFGFTRAMFTNVFRKRYAQGASTITQQVAKNIFLTPNKTVKRKVQELILSLWLERKFSKEQIMALYLNRVYFGSGNYGAAAAANWYFNKSVYDINVREAAILAGMLKAPNRYNPILKRDNALKRANVVLQNMKKYKFLNATEYQEALNLPVSNGQQYRVTGGKHFAQYVYDEVNAFIGERTEDIVVMTTLDQKLQETAEKILRNKIYSAKDKNVSEGAVIILDKTGAVKAMVGGVDYNRSQFNRATQARRQAGSAFKPFVYLTALQIGFTPASIIEDKAITIGKWKPENYTKRYYGNVSLTYALAQSLNAATVRLSRELYLKDVAANAHKMGLTTDLSLTPSMVLGTNAVKVIDMATAYATIANGGYKIWPHTINEVATADGRQLYVRDADKPVQILKTNDVLNLTQMLESVINQGTGHKAKLPIFAAGKTGTTQNYRDAWFIGWTNKYIAAVWVGNDNDKPMNKVGGGSLPAEIWHDIMLTTVKDTPAGAPKYLPFPQTNEDVGSLLRNITNKSTTKHQQQPIPSNDAENDDTFDAIGALIEMTN
ncbi:MAG: PBP1A family penicillin-binding protein [Alphaproteobacteria bacterium]|nr:PBP1A family penicillin-binding protein [Alphaproteobacteria bacterium]